MTQEKSQFTDSLVSLQSQVPSMVVMVAQSFAHQNISPHHSHSNYLSAKGQNQVYDRDKQKRRHNNYLGGIQFANTVDFTTSLITCEWLG